MSKKSEESARSSFIGSFSKGIGKLRGSSQQQSESLNQEDNDETGYLSRIAFMKNEKKDLEREEQSIFTGFRHMVRRWSYLALLISAYTLLNVFIGYSSAPFYAKLDQCSEFDPDENCVALMSATSTLYSVEFLSGAYVLVQAMLAVILFDNIQSVKIAKILNKVTQVGILFYPGMAVVRSIAYMQMHA